MSLSSSFEEIIQRRRSNRKFDANVEVPDDVIVRSLERSILSPNSSNMQLWEFQWIKDPALKESFTALCLDQNAARTYDLHPHQMKGFLAFLLLSCILPRYLHCALVLEWKKRLN